MNDKKTIAKELEKMGRGGDTILAHINPQEAAILKMLGGSGTINPHTGLPEFDWWSQNVTRPVSSGLKSVEREVFRPIGGAIESGFSSVGKAISGGLPGIKAGLSKGASRLGDAVKDVAPYIPLAVAILNPALITTLGSSILGTSAATAGVAEIAAGNAALAAASSAASGKNVKEIAKSAVTAGLSSYAGETVSNAFGNTLVNSGVPVAAAKVAASGAGAAAAAFARGARGKDLWKAAASGAVGSAGVQLYKEVTTQQPAPIETATPTPVTTPVTPTEVSQAPTTDQDVIDLIQKQAQEIAGAPTAPGVEVAQAPSATATDVTAPTTGELKTVPVTELGATPITPVDKPAEAIFGERTEGGGVTEATRLPPSGPETTFEFSEPTAATEEQPLKLTIEGVGDRTPEPTTGVPPVEQLPETPVVPAEPPRFDFTTVPDIFGITPVVPTVPPVIEPTTPSFVEPEIPSFVEPTAPSFVEPETPSFVEPTVPPTDYGLVPETPTGGAPGFAVEPTELPPAETIGQQPIDYGGTFTPTTPSEGFVPPDLTPLPPAADIGTTPIDYGNIFQPETPSLPEMGGGTGVLPGEGFAEPTAPEVPVPQPPTAFEEGYPTDTTPFEEGYPTEEELPPPEATPEEIKFGITRLPSFRYPSAGRGSPLVDTGLFGMSDLTTTGFAPTERGRKTYLDEESTEEPTGKWGSQTLRGLLGI